MARVASVATLHTLALDGQAHRRWYVEGVPALQAMADGLGVDFQLLCDVVAITSPRVHVVRNIRIARDYLSRRAELATLDGAAIARALGTIPSTGAALAHYERTGRIRGPKTRAFSDAIQGDPDALVLDVWMSRALGVPQSRLFTKDVHGKAVARVGRVARRLGWTVAETQAAIWAGAIARHTDSRGRRTYVDAPPLKAAIAAA
jgi:hypothetical protein